MLVSIDDRTSALSAILHSRHFAAGYLPADAKNLVDVFGVEQSGKAWTYLRPMTEAF